MAEDKRAAGRAMRRKLMGDAYADKLDNGVYSHPIMEKFAAYTQEAVFGSLWTRPGLDLKTRALICVISDAAQGRDPELKLHLRFARNQGWTEDELSEALLHLAGYVGAPSGAGSTPDRHRGVQGNECGMITRLRRAAATSQISSKVKDHVAMQDLRGKTAIVTGAASGIGLGIARALATAGANVVLADLRAEPLAAARKSIETTGARVATAVVDVCDPQSVEAAGKVALDNFGALHIAVNNAGVAMHGTALEDVTLEEWNWVLGVNVTGVIHGIRAFVPMIRSHGQGGHVVNTGSVSSLFVREGRNQGAYAMTKYAVLALSEALEQELKGSGIGVSVLCPGGVRTSIFDSATTRPDRFGGSYSRPEQEALKAVFAPSALDPDVVGRRVLQAIRDDEFYVLTHTGERDAITARFDRIRAAFDRADEIMPKLLAHRLGSAHRSRRSWSGDAGRGFGDGAAALRHSIDLAVAEQQAQAVAGLDG